MKISTLVLGFLTFSVVVTIMFSAVQDYLTQNEFGGASEWGELAGDYEAFVGETITNENATLRQMSEQTKTGEAGSEAKQIVLLEGAISGGKLGTNFFFNLDVIANKIGADTKTYVDPRIVAAVIGIIMIVIILSVLFFLRGFKAET